MIAALVILSAVLGVIFVLWSGICVGNFPWATGREQNNLGTACIVFFIIGLSFALTAIYLASLS